MQIKNRVLGINAMVRMLDIYLLVFNLLRGIKTKKNKIRINLIAYYNIGKGIPTDVFIVDQEDREEIFERIIKYREYNIIKSHENLLSKFVKNAPTQFFGSVLDDRYFPQLRLQFDFLKSVYSFLQIKSTVPEQMEKAESILARAPARFQQIFHDSPELEPNQNTVDIKINFIRKLNQEKIKDNSIFKLLSKTPNLGVKCKPFFQLTSKGIIFSGSKTYSKAFVNWLYTEYFNLGIFESLDVDDRYDIYRIFFNEFQPEFITDKNVNEFIRRKNFTDLSLKSDSNNYKQIIEELKNWIDT